MKREKRNVYVTPKTKTYCIENSLLAASPISNHDEKSDKPQLGKENGIGWEEEENTIDKWYSYEWKYVTEAL